MPKINTMISLDMELKHTAQKLKINISEMCNRVLMNMVSSRNEEVDSIRLRFELEQLQIKIGELKVKESEIMAALIAEEEKQKLSDKQQFDENTKKFKAIKAAGILEDIAGR